jgi:hypothetical protein
LPRNVLVIHITILITFLYEIIGLLTGTDVEINEEAVMAVTIVA